ncbi:MAG: motility associated factor glycosyltransferase family protein [Spirochaetaceae bacterium]|nr:motility associated factor glycosyltransferase family protein [Spirochaetaceae bacterium]
MPDLPDSSVYKKNIDAFRTRFPELFALMEQNLLPDGKAPALPQNTTLQQAKNGSWTALFEGTLLHSSYNPEREAEKLVSAVSDKEFSSGVFLGTGLGYAPVCFAEKFPKKTLIIIEPDVNRLITAFYTVDLQPIFRHLSCIILTGATHPQIIALLEKVGLEDCHFFETLAHELHDPHFFNSLKRLVERNKQKHKINSRTLKTFSRLWFSNMCRNIDQMALRTGISAFEGKAAGIPACIIAAGPSLDTVLPFLAELKKRCILICVDTALRACLRTGVQPHFVVLTDPQFWNARHIAGLSAPETILITETAAYPTVFRFDCKSIHLCSSFFPLGQYIEKHTHINGKLGTGGSVASTTWDFARFCGCRTIYVAGLDLGFPSGKTHTKGSTFEEKAHIDANRLKNAETSISGVLFSANSITAKSYDGHPIKTDNRMTMYAWWFESRCAEYTDVHTITLTPESLAIPGIKQITPQQNPSTPALTPALAAVLSEPSREKEIDAFIESCEKESLSTSYEERRSTLYSALKSLHNDLLNMKQCAEKAVFLCKTHCRNDAEYKRVTSSLSECDKMLLKSEVSELASLLFPGKEELDALKAGIKPDSTNPYAANLRTSELVYARILDSIEQWENRLPH